MRTATRPRRPDPHGLALATLPPAPAPQPASVVEPPGLTEILAPLRAYGGPQPFGSREAAELLDVEPRTVTSWATARKLSGLKLANNIGWRFTIRDLVEFLTKRYYAARR
ncbi:helix-turn-helix domain-containing protein [Candidatus Frankia alpina]|uniref:Helix-turn-helix domain-containing protein n=1 Tax=Candidatus Frankia alpina TaxID=2699483 RepID=A0A4S5ECQ4_9ACTN|nr:helix-turn-helix domain-containing protein [Candidatus Frankia alpina]THJ69615.1 helix-turn-helix domain-containing protein [Candidatus Frankia alpina]